MRKITTAILILTVLALAMSMSAATSQPDMIVDGLNATDDITQALDDAENQNKTIAIFFDKDSCYYCDLLKSDTLSDKNVQKELNDNFIVLFVDINRDPQLAGEFQVVGTPTVSFLDHDNKEVSRINGYLPADEFLDALKEI